VLGLERMEETVVFCINCDKLLSLSQISQHSNECYRPDLEDQGTFERINMNLRNFRKTLTDFLKKNQGLNKENRHVIKSCITKCKEVENSEVELESLSLIASKLENYLENFDDILITVIVQRFKVLVEDKAFKIIEKIKESAVQIEDEPTLNHQKLLKKFSGDFLKSKKIHIDPEDNEISFTVYTKDIEKSFKNLNSENFAFEDDEDEMVDRMYEHFKNLCMICRLGFNYRHPSQKCSLVQLYKKSIGFGISPENWENFIVSEFQNF
jgi:hypothetical protein